ncbi:MAG: NHL repeat-containing protein [Candidatus Bathyarchaeia archaeon]
MSTVIWSRNLLRTLLLALMLIGSILTSAYAFTTGMPASLVIGQSDFTTGAAHTTQTGLREPVSLRFDSSGNLWVSDWSNNRVLMFKPPFSTGMAASLVIGQVDFTQNSGATSQTGLSGPYGLGFDAAGNLWVSDGSNSRVLMFKPPFSTGMAASLVIGQSGFTTSTAQTTQTGLHWPWDLGFDASGNLWVADWINNRVLMFKPPFSTGMAASLVIGHKSFLWNGLATNQTGLNRPIGLRFDALGNLWVSEGSNNRVLMFKPPFATGMAASLVIGQSDFTTGTAQTTQTGLHSPTGLGFDASGNLWVVEDANNRVLMFKPPFTTGMAASLVIGQADFTHGSGATTQTGLHAPMGLDFDTVGNLWVVEDANNRVLMFPGSTGLSAFLLELQAGWNLISLPLVPTQTATAKLLTPLIQLHELVVAWGFTAPNTWSYFKPPNLGTLTTMVDGKGYWVLVTDAINITIAGYVITPGSAPPTYSLAAGWNLFGFKPQPLIQNETMATYLTSLDTKYSSIWVYDNLNATWIRGTPELVLAPGEGIWIYMTTPATLLP